MPCRAWRFTRASWSPPAPGHQDLVPCGSRHSHGSMAQQPRCTEGHSGAVAPGTGSSRLGWAGPEACWRGGLRGGPGLGGRCLRGQMHPGGPARGPPAGLDAPGPRRPQLPGDLCCCPGWWRPFKCAGVVSRQQGRRHWVTLHPVRVPGPVLAPAPPRPSCPLRGAISLARCSENSISFN